MKRIVLLTFLLGVVVCVTGSALGQNLVIYPAKAQSQQQMEMDKFQCYTWAKQESGFDPVQAGSGTQPPPPSQGAGGDVVGGAARGAAVGAVAGAIGGDAGKGAAAGAAGGALIGAMRHRQRQAQQAQAQQQQSAAIAQRQNNYNRAFGACMEGRGYIVK